MATCVPLTVAPSAGAVSVTLGAWFTTVTPIGEVVLALPASSVALAVIDTGPSATAVESQAIEYGAVVSVPTLVPLRRNSTPVTAPSSEAVAEIVTPDPLTVAPSAGAVSATVGGVVSLRTETVTAALVPMLPLESVALAVIATLPSGTVVESHVI